MWNKCLICFLARKDIVPTPKLVHKMIYLQWKQLILLVSWTWSRRDNSLANNLCLFWSSASCPMIVPEFVFSNCEQRPLRWSFGDLEMFTCSYSWLILPPGTGCRRWSLWLVWASCWDFCGLVWDGTTWPWNRPLLLARHVQVQHPPTVKSNRCSSGGETIKVIKSTVLSVWFDLMYKL